MDNPESYKNSKALRDDNHAQLLEEYTARFNWRSDGRDSVLDIGSAGGNTTCDLILPKLPSTFSQLIGVDINKNMVDYATKTYPIPKVSFKLLDIGADINEFKHKHGPFDHIISLFCLHLVPDQKLALQNVYDLLGTNGDCFLHFMCDYDGFDVYRKTYTKWSEYMLDIDEFVSPYHGKISPVNMITKLIKGTGFTTYTVEERRKCIVYHDVQSFLGAFVPVLPFFSRIPLDRQAEYLDDYVKFAMEAKPDPGMEIQNFKAGQDINIYVSYKTVLVFARK